LFRSRNVESPRAADLVDPHQVVEQPFGDFLCIETILEQRLGFAKVMTGRLSG